MYNPSDVGKKGTLFGLPYSEREADLIILPVHLDVTTSYGAGTANAPDLILDESTQLDLSLTNVNEPWKLKLALGDRIVSKDKNDSYRVKAKNRIEKLEAGNKADEEELADVNSFCAEVHQSIEGVSRELLTFEKLVGIVGGDHSSPLGLIKALSPKESFGILQIDAHMDLRKAYEGFDYSHASIMNNALKEEGVQSLTQVGIRDFCEEEELFIKKAEKPIHAFYDSAMYAERAGGATWKQQVDQIIDTLPDQVYISFDIDGLDPSLCPNTGTPVPGGVSFNQANLLLEEVVRAGKKIVGFDLCEVGNGAFDANVGARVLYRLCVLMGVSHGLLSFK